MGKSWKTLSAGIAMVAGGLVGLYFAFQANNVNEATLTTAIGTVLGGLGLIFAKDADVTGAGDSARRIK